MQHLREFADYLKPHRAFSALRIPALFLMGFTTNFFVLLPLLLAIAAVTYVIWSDEIEHALCTNSSELVLTESDFDKDGTKVIQLERYLVPPETCDQNTRKAVWVNLMNVPSRAHVQDLPGCKIQSELSNRSQTILKCDPSDRPQRQVKIDLAAFDDPFEDDLEITIRSWATPKPRKVYHPTYWPQRCANNRQLVLKQSDLDDSGRYEVRLERFLVPPKTCSPTKGSKVLLDLVNLPLSSFVNDDPESCAILDDGSSPSRTRLECDPDTDKTLLIDPRDFDEALREHPQITVEARWNDHGFETDPISALTDSTFNVVLAFLWLFVALMVAYPLWKIPKLWGTRDTITRMFGGALLLLLAITAIELQPLGTYYFASAVGAPKTGTLLGNLGDAAVFLMVSATVIGGLIARSSAAKKFGGTILMYAVAIIGFLTLWLVAAYFTLWLLDCTHVPGIDMLSTGPAHDSLYGFFKFLNVIQPDRWIYFTDPTQCSLQQPSTELAFTYFVLVLLLLWLTRHRFNINKTSFHHFYRDRLSRAFSFNPWGKSLEHVEDVPLEGLATDRGPLHILNATLNLPSTKIGSLKGRRCDFFTFTPLRVGGQLTGYARTRDYAQAERGFDLISAMAVSGAAAAPTMGIYTNRALVFLMALLNVRLDFWAHNPNLHARPPVKVDAVGAAYLAREMFGMLDETEPFINLSDGGHLENLGVYELIRRHCKLIICSDCQADEGMMFDGLADLIRMVRIDMGIEIDIDVGVLKRAEGKSKAGLSKAHFAVGTIDYGDDEENGVLIYIKASLTGDEGLYIDNYRSDHPSFPNETTADQFFDEPQFEAYRSLGQHIAVEFLKSDAARSWLANDEFDANEILKSARRR